MKKIIAIILFLVVILTVIHSLAYYCTHVDEPGAVCWTSWKKEGKPKNCGNKGHYYNEVREGECTICGIVTVQEHAGDYEAHSYKTIKDNRKSVTKKSNTCHSIVGTREEKCDCDATRTINYTIVEPHSWFLGFWCLTCGATK